QIQNLLERGSVDLHTALVLVNAIYFKGIWKTAFKEEDTRELPFRVTKQQSRPVQMMCQNSTFKVAAVPAEKIKILGLPYASGQLSMLVLLPDDISGLEQVWAWQGKQKSYHFSGTWVLSDLLLSVYIAAAHTTAVLGRQGSPRAPQVLPGAQAESGLLEEPWAQSNKTYLHQSLKIFIYIKHSSESEEFRADHPFLFLVKHNPTNSILFFGKYCSP
ncbi:OVALX protein, partial [Glareola pratincola]|nr:OVALX protein [Glareola pratincola]